MSFAVRKIKVAHKNGITHVCYSPLSGQYFISCSYSLSKEIVKLWETKSLKLIWESKMYDFGVYFLGGTLLSFL